MFLVIFLYHTCFTYARDVIGIGSIVHSGRAFDQQASERKIVGSNATLFTVFGSFDVPVSALCKYVDDE